MSLWVGQQGRAGAGKGGVSRWLVCVPRHVLYMVGAAAGMT
jgi:hypothetical protein